MNTELDRVAKEILNRHKCGCEICAHSAALCPATASSLIMELAEKTIAAELWSKERGELKRTILELRDANIYNQTAGTDDEPDWVGIIAELTKQRDHALKERGELEAKLNIRGPFKAAQPQVYFFCEWAVYKKDAVSSICYTTSKEVADWIASRLNERDTLAAELAKVKESQSIPLNVSTAAYSLIGYCQSVEHLKDRLWDITWGDGLTQYADRLKAALTQTQPVLDYKHDETI
jgi:hypothetical protein